MGEDADGEDAGPGTHAAEGEATDGEERERASLGARSHRANRGVGTTVAARRGRDHGRDRATLLAVELGAAAAAEGAALALPRRAAHGARRRDN